MSGGNRTPTINQDEIVTEDVVEEESIDESVVDQPGPITRSRTRSGLRNIKNPPGSHRNRYEREFSYQTTGSVASRSNDEIAKARSGRFRNRWVNNKKGKTKRKKRNEMSMFVDVIMTQLSKGDKHAQVSIKEGLKRHGDRDLDALLKEFGQLYKHNTFDPQDISILTPEMRKEALNLITMIKEKRSGAIKARACADGRKQRRYISKEEVASPTIQLESLIMSLIIDAREGRDVAIADVVGAYLLANMKDYVLVKLTGKTVDIMCGVSKDYEKFVAIENGRRVLYLKLRKAIYGCM